MDNLTHGLVGAALARMGLERATPLATTTLVVAANAPDLDMVSFVRGEYAALAFRRGLTHGLPAMAVLPFVVAGAILAGDRWIRRRRSPAAAPARPGAVLGLSFLGLLTHPVLDWMNTYGMRWWLPFDGSWSYGDALFIIDPWLWLGLGGAVALTGSRSRPALLGWAALAAAATSLVLLAPLPGASKVAWGIGITALVILWPRSARATARGRRRVGRGVTAAAAAWVGLMVLTDRLARRDVVEAARREGLPVETVIVAPRPADPLGADVVVHTAGGYVPGSHRWLRSPRVVLRREAAWPVLDWGAGLSRPEAEAIAEAAWRAREAADFGVWARLVSARVEVDRDGYRVRITDARYAGRGAGSLEGVTVRLGPRLDVLGAGPPDATWAPGPEG